jgi:hypothetical protein
LKYGCCLSVKTSSALLIEGVLGEVGIKTEFHFTLEVGSQGMQEIRTNTFCLREVCWELKGSKSDMWGLPGVFIREVLSNLYFLR